VVPKNVWWFMQENPIESLKRTVTALRKAGYNTAETFQIVREQFEEDLQYLNINYTPREAIRLRTRLISDYKLIIDEKKGNNIAT